MLTFLSYFDPHERRLVMQSFVIGESISAGLFKPRTQLNGRFNRLMSWWRPTDPVDLQTAQLSGISAAVATLLGAPFTAAFFATEVMFRKRPVIEKLIYSLISALVAILFALNNSIYRTQRDAYRQRQILPGYGSRRLPVPEKWDGRTLIDLDLRRDFDVNIIGLVDRGIGDDVPRVRLSAEAGRPLNTGDILVVMGLEEALNALQAEMEGDRDRERERDRDREGEA